MPTFLPPRKSVPRLKISFKRSGEEKKKRVQTPERVFERRRRETRRRRRGGKSIKRDQFKTIVALFISVANLWLFVEKERWKKWFCGTAAARAHSLAHDVSFGGGHGGEEATVCRYEGLGTKMARK